MMNVPIVLEARKDYLRMKKRFEGKPTPSLLFQKKATYLALRTFFLRDRRLERTAAALAEAKAEVTRLRAENAKHRAALDEVAGVAGRAGFIYSGSAANVFVLICSVAAIAALETAPTGEATNGNG